ncbi:cupin domain-containing protein [Roseofilum sp. BLCC_M154]|uniref:Cupin domain-containing protein n=1 Tax=Roseofilum acuticapitatum BLCC-M154 TaxID=3022444 RepID=A0ABT7B137_9CYAN|nr:cupin domain-containing protein [Roseofilum acuticapitatum]MDJ1172251.1 cupin domain-containing protein [Roseofilum acuticapitatum BLCC-M154]
MVSTIQIEHQPSREHLDRLGIWDCTIWEKEVSEFPWTYDCSETCYLLTGEVIVTPDDGEPVQFAQGDLVTFPAGLSCTWKILKPVRKHYFME